MKKLLKALIIIGVLLVAVAIAIQIISNKSAEALQEDESDEYIVSEEQLLEDEKQINNNQGGDVQEWKTVEDFSTGNEDTSYNYLITLGKFSETAIDAESLKSFGDEFNAFATDNGYHSSAFEIVSVESKDDESGDAYYEYNIEAQKKNSAQNDVIYIKWSSKNKKWMFSKDNIHFDSEEK